MGWHTALDPQSPVRPRVPKKQEEVFCQDKSYLTEEEENGEKGKYEISSHI